MVIIYIAKPLFCHSPQCNHCLFISILTRDGRMKKVGTKEVHVYVNNIKNLAAVYFDTPLFGDHVLVITELSVGPQDQLTNSCLKRDWRLYTSDEIINTVSQLLNERYPFECNDVQSGWNIIENVLITATDLHAPLVETSETDHAKKKVSPQ